MDFSSQLRKIFIKGLFLVWCSPLYSDQCYPKPFAAFYVGCSWSAVSDINVDLSVWDPAYQGYDNDLGSTSIIGTGIGLFLNPLFSLMLDLSYRPRFEYEKFQIAIPAGTPNSIPVKTLFFELSNTSLLASIFLNKEGNYFKGLFRGFAFSPFIGGGVGIAYNKLYNFHSEVPDSDIVRSVENAFTQTSFAAEWMAGFVSKLNRQINFEIGYRFLYGGYFTSNNYGINRASLTSGPVYAPSWKSHLCANELFVSLIFKK